MNHNLEGPPKDTARMVQAVEEGVQGGKLSIEEVISCELVVARLGLQLEEVGMEGVVEVRTKD